MTRRNLKTGLFAVICLFCLFGPTQEIQAQALSPGFGKTVWGMELQEIVDLYQIQLKQPETADPGGIWAFVGPAEGEFTVSGEALGEPDVRSISFGIHPKWGLGIAHVRFKNTNDPKFIEKLLPKWIARFGPPKERKLGPKIIWEDAETHIELTYHTVSPRHPSPTDHLAIVLWSIPLMEKIESESMDPMILPDVEKLEPMKELHKK